MCPLTLASGRRGPHLGLKVVGNSSFLGSGTFPMSSLLSPGGKRLQHRVWLLLCLYDSQNKSQVDAGHRLGQEGGESQQHDKWRNVKASFSTCPKCAYAWMSQGATNTLAPLWPLKPELKTVLPIVFCFVSASTEGMNHWSSMQ